MLSAKGKDWEFSVGSVECSETQLQARKSIPRPVLPGPTTPTLW